jgi:hydroxymethylpyrimidine/phosphomethylpyrimidine kinase
MQAVLSDIGADVLKTGMLGDTRLIEMLAEAFADLARGVPRVIDPVMVATSGDSLLPREAVDAVRRLMVPGATVVTPNAREAEVLTGKSVESVDGQRRAGDRLLAM